MRGSLTLRPPPSLQPFVEEGHVLLSLFPSTEYILLPLVSICVVLLASALAYIGAVLLTAG
jgi:hypothetical protein